MPGTAELEPLPDSVVVFRLVPPDNREFYNADLDLPHPVVFALSAADKGEQPPRLSVWDVAKTTVAQAIAIRVASGWEEKRQVAFRLSVRRIREISERLDVVDDPLTTPLLPGSDGHAGITGLLATKAEKAAIKKIRWDLVEACTRHY